MAHRLVLVGALTDPVLVDTPAAATRAAAEFAGAELLAVDTEFHSERRYIPKLFLVQVRARTGPTWIFDPLVPGVLDAIAPAMVGSSWLVHGGSWDIVLLQRALGGVAPTILDTQIGAGLVGCRYPERYSRLVARFTDHAVDKSQTLSDWSARPLSTAQLGYASGDVEILHELWDAIATELDSHDRSQVAIAACDEARELALHPPSADTRWREVAGASVMHPQQAAVLQELVVWREELARKLDTPARSLASNGVLIWLAREQPVDVRRLSNRKIPKSLAKKHGQELIDRVSLAARRPEWGWPAPIHPRSIERARATWLHAWAVSRGLAEHWSPRLVLPPALIDDIVTSLPDASRRSSLLGWRQTFIGEDLERALLGEVPLPWPDSIDVRGKFFGGDKSP